MRGQHDRFWMIFPNDSCGNKQNPRMLSSEDPLQHPNAQCPENVTETLLMGQRPGEKVPSCSPQGLSGWVPSRLKVQFR